jgi:hypothetical protein
MLEVREATDADVAVVPSFVRKKADFDRELGAFTGVGFYAKFGASLVERAGDVVTLQIEPGSLSPPGANP